MAFDSGTLSFCIYKYNEELAEDHISQLEAKAAPPLKDIMDEPVTGWAVRHLLDREFTPETCYTGDFLHLNFLQAQRKAPAAFVKAECARRELEESAETSLSRKRKKEIKEDVEDQLMKQSLPTLRGIPILVDPQEKLIYIGTASPKSADSASSLLIESLDIAPLPMTAANLIQLITQKHHSDYKRLELVPEKSESDDETYPGRDFLTWLWYRSEKESVEFQVPDLGILSFVVDGPITLCTDSSNARESVIRRGVPTLSPEASSALCDGKKLKSAKISFAHGEDIWSFTFDADNFCFKSLKFPEGEAMGRTAVFEERAEHLYRFQVAMTSLFSDFLQVFMGNEREIIISEMRKWLKERLALTLPQED